MAAVSADREVMMKNPMIRYLCCSCAEALKNGYDVMELADEKADTERIVCAFCGHRVYGGKYRVSDKEDGHAGNT
jgi:DNA-directed RNA polymerase subunit RPC12/RpoP